MLQQNRGGFFFPLWSEELKDFLSGKQCFALFRAGFGGILLTASVHGVTLPPM